MIKRMLLGLAVALAIGSSGACNAAIVVSGEFFPVTEQFTGDVAIGIYATSNVDTVILSYNVPTLFTNPAVASFVSFEATNFGFGTETANVLSAPFAANRGFSGAAGNVPAIANQRLKVGEITFSVSNAPAGQTEVGQFLNTGFDANFFQFNTSQGTVNASNGLATVGNPSLGIQATAVPEPSSLGVLAIGLVASTFRGRRKRVA
ncbi:PEP-CTERM sorting domain-containing protein [Rubripirellula reticaptiva]|uniref:PEP-CTERM motif protein n=1 Tax=Rubripirellula reticaptiva TaxID=2528013 RepID=A0A5C6ENP8_9BACT|nr:PEP-CTERM sorting domain-containing protein [Rubripirellula reticaptiva]TWU49226.1 PEP-CTERM motif protein [Rubripirellula reticaptiva]